MQLFIDVIRVDLEDTYDPVQVGEDLSFMTFFSVAKSTKPVLIKIKISSLGDPFLPNVFNLSFGPMLPNGEIDDKVKIGHLNTAKVFSTILLFSLAYLQSRPEITIGVDGSNDVRAYLYHRMFQTNKDYLNEYFITIGVDWYVRLLRNGGIEKDADGFPFFKPKPEPFDYARNSSDLYRYYMFHLRQQL